jgi:hypothetical protein
MCEAGQMSTIFLAGNDLCVLALNDIVNLNCFIFTCCYNRFSLVIKIKGCDVGALMFGKLESLIWQNH